MKEVDVISDPNPQVCGMENAFLPPAFYKKEARGGAGAAERPIPLPGSPVCPERSCSLQRHKAKPSVLLRIQAQAAVFKTDNQQDHL